MKGGEFICVINSVWIVNKGKLNKHLKNIYITLLSQIENNYWLYQCFDQRKKLWILITLILWSKKEEIPDNIKYFFN